LHPPRARGTLLAGSLPHIELSEGLLTSCKKNKKASISAVAQVAKIVRRAGMASQLGASRVGGGAHGHPVQGIPKSKGSPVQRPHQLVEDSSEYSDADEDEGDDDDPPGYAGVLPKTLSFCLMTLERLQISFRAMQISCPLIRPCCDA